MRAVCSCLRRCVLLIEDIRSIAQQQQVARPLQDFALVDVLFHVILRPAYLVQLLIHQFDHMKMVEDMHGVRAVFKYGGDESGREIGGDILDVEFLSSDSFPKSGQSIGRLALALMENPPALEVNDSGLVHMPFSDGKLVYADTVHSLKRGWSIVILKMMRVNLFDRVPRHAQKTGCVFEGHSLQ